MSTGMQISQAQVAGLAAALADAGGGAPLATTAPSNDLSTAAVGTSEDAARADHQHQFPLATISRTITAAGLALNMEDHGKVVVWNHENSGTGIVLPNTLPQGFNCIVRVASVAVPRFYATSPNATVNQADGLIRARKQWSEVSISVHANSDGTHAVYVLSGDMA